MGFSLARVLYFHFVYNPLWVSSPVKLALLMQLGHHIQSEATVCKFDVSSPVKQALLMQLGHHIQSEATVCKFDEGVSLEIWPSA